MSINRTRTVSGMVRWDVCQNDTIVASFNSYCDAVDFVRFFEEL